MNQNGLFWNYSNFQFNLTSNDKFRRALRLAERVDGDHFTDAAVFWSDSEDVHGAHAKRVGDVVVVVKVDADVVQVPGHSGRRAPPHSTRHVELVSCRWCVDFQRHQDGWRPLKAESWWITSIWRFWNLIEGRKKRKNMKDWKSNLSHFYNLIDPEMFQTFVCITQFWKNRFYGMSYPGLCQHGRRLTVTMLT